VSITALIEQVDEVLERAEALFGDPVSAGPAVPFDSALATAGDLVRSGQARMAPMSGDLASRYRRFAAGAGPTLYGVAGADEALGGQMQAAAGADRSGRAGSGAVRAAAAGDATVLTPVAGTPAGQRALVAALRARVAAQRHIVEVQRVRDAQLAGRVRELAYGRARRRSRGMPWRTSVGEVPGVPNESGEAAANAALTRLGCRYLWGAKGPNAFDCSGLTQWAWRQAGVRLGNDTYSQIADGVPVAPDQVRAGDLIFPLDDFGEGGRSGPGHVQLAISGDQVVHAPTSGDVVRIAPMPRHFIARRPVSASIGV
jgi:cell wall-associated NlpC family hydrolase